MTWTIVLAGLFIWRGLHSPSDERLMQGAAFPPGTKHELRHQRQLFGVTETLQPGDALRFRVPADPHALEPPEHGEYDPCRHVRLACAALDRHVVRKAGMRRVVHELQHRLRRTEPL